MSSVTLDIIMIMISSVIEQCMFHIRNAEIWLVLSEWPLRSCGLETIKYNVLLNLYIKRLWESSVQKTGIYHKTFIYIFNITSSMLRVLSALFSIINFSSLISTLSFPLSLSAKDLDFFNGGSASNESCSL